MRMQTSSLVFLHYLTTVFDNLDEAILLLGIEPDEHYRILLANQSFARITGRDVNPIGELVADAVKPKTFELLKRRYRQVIATKQPVYFTEEYEVPLGMQTYEVKLIPVLNTVGDVVQIAAITRNVTETEMLRKELAALRKTHGLPKKSL